MTHYEDFNPVFGPAVLERHQGRLTEVGGFVVKVCGFSLDGHFRTLMQGSVFEISANPR